MSTTWAALRVLLADKYDEFRSRLTRQLGSEEFAQETLHETWLRLNRPGDAGMVQSPTAFVLRIAANVANDALRAERRRARGVQINSEIADLADMTPGPAQTTEARLELAAVQKILSELPPRTYAILVASRLEGLSHQSIADRHGISRRTVVYELRRAADHLDSRFAAVDTINAVNAVRDGAPPQDDDAGKS